MFLEQKKVGFILPEMWLGGLGIEWIWKVIIFFKIMILVFLFFIYFLFRPPPKVFCHFVQTIKYKTECSFLPDLFLVVLVGLFSFQRLNLFLAFIMDKLPLPASIVDQILKPLKAHFICFTFIWVDFTEKKDAASNVAHPERDVAQSPAAKELHRDRQEQRRLCIWIARSSSQHKVSFLNMYILFFCCMIGHEIKWIRLKL
jgi:hypothetical protein